MIIQRGYLAHVKEMKKAYRAYECSSSEKYEEIAYYYQTAWGLALDHPPHQNEMNYLFCHSLEYSSRE